LVFVGGYSWYPNRDAMAYFGKTILPLVRRRYPDLSVTWVGRAPDAVKRDFENLYGIRLTGYVDDVRPVVSGAACYVVPLRVGGGTRLKILDAWAMGKAVVSTSIGCEGLDARDGENILIRDTPESFAEAVDAVLKDDDLRTRLERNARATAESVYDWSVIGGPMLREYLHLLSGSCEGQARGRSEN
jgi:glycosyltransferase involved in cell wall biosynthesis